MKEFIFAVAIISATLGSTWLISGALAGQMQAASISIGIAK